MNWINKLINKANKNNTEATKDIPNNLWIKCPTCLNLLFIKDVSKNNHVCINCDHHFFLPVDKRLETLFDDSHYINIPFKAGLLDPLKFQDKDKYSDKLKSYKAKTGKEEAISAGYGKIGNTHSVIAAMDFTFLGGSMGTYVGEAFVNCVEYAIARKSPFVIVTASGGARMQEGLFSLMQMAKTTVAIEKLKDQGLPYVVVLVNPTTGGVTASFAMLGDIHIAEKGATIGFAGARVIEQTIRKKLPEGFQRSEYLLDHGMVDIVVHRKDLKTQLANILDLLMNRS